MANPNDWRELENQQLLWTFYIHALEQLEKGVRGAFEVWHYNVLFGLTRSGLHTLRHLRQGWPEEDISRLAWAARNALELEIWFEFVTAVKENAYRFHLDWLNDTSALLSQAVAYEVSEPPSDPSQDNAPVYPYPDMDHGGHTVENAMKFLAEQRAQHAVFPTKYLRVSEVARSLGREDQFRNANSLFSKHIHPTALSVLSFPSDRARHNKSVLMLVNGCFSLVRILGTLDNFLKSQSLPDIMGNAQ